jgi:hypothetical protein
MICCPYPMIERPNKNAVDLVKTEDKGQKTDI